jgi:hypothetical protein
MIPFTILGLLTLAIGYAYYKYKTRIPAGLRALPGPIGMAMVNQFAQDFLITRYEQVYLSSAVSMMYLPKLLG